MGEITAVFDDVKEVVGDKGFLILGAVAAGIFAINLLKKDDNSDATGNTLVQASGYTSYPSVEQNANVIIDSLQNSIDYAQGSIMEQNKENFSGMSESLGELGNNIQDMNADMRDFLQENFDATNDYINEGLARQATLISMNNAQLKDSIENMGNSLTTTIANTKNDLTNSNQSILNAIHLNNTTSSNSSIGKQKIQSVATSENKKPQSGKQKIQSGATSENKSGSATGKNKADLKVNKNNVIKLKRA